MNCRHCSRGLSLQMVDLGASPPSNDFNPSQDVAEKHYPLRVLVCTHCWLAQTDISLFKLDHDALFKDDYPYFSSTSPSWVAHAKSFVEAMSDRMRLGEKSLMVEVGANDGYLLQWMKTPCYGVEPTKTGEEAKKKGLEIYPQFFGSAWATNAVDLKGQADLMVANNVLAHVPDINDFVRGFAILLKDKGIASFEFPHLLNLVKGGQFDTIYHEHYSYLSLTAVMTIFRASGLEIFEVERIATHGGSLRVLAGHPGAHPVTSSVKAVLAQEGLQGMWTPDFYADFQTVADRIKHEFVEFLLRAKNMQRSVVGFGAAAKGNTFLNYAGVKSDLLSYVVDDTHAKQGKFLPGSRIPVQRDFSTKPDYIVILPWNFREEIMQRLAFTRKWGAKFVTAIPRLEMV